jgi:hypothetical protein
MPRNPNLRIHLERDQGNWRFSLHKDGKQHCSTRGYVTAEEATTEAIILNSMLDLAADRERRKAEAQPASNDAWKI